MGSEGNRAQSHSFLLVQKVPKLSGQDYQDMQVCT